MNKEIFKNFETKRGSLNNIDEVIDAFEQPMYEDDLLKISGLDIATLNRNNYSVKFLDDNRRAFFIQETISSGLLDFVKENLKIDEVPENIAVLVAIDRNLNEAEKFYKNENKSLLSKILDNFLKSENDKQYEKLDNHRHKLKEEQIKKSNNIKI